MNKVLILGNSGSGKSTFGRLLSDKLNIDVLFLDVFVFDKDWNEPNYSHMEEVTKEFMKKDKYILDGNFLHHSKERFDDCDTIIFLDVNRFTCLKSVIARKKQYANKQRESRNDNLSERINLSYLNWVLFGFYFKSKPQIKKLLKQHKDKNIVVLKSRKKIEKYILELKAN